MQDIFLYFQDGKTARVYREKVCFLKSTYVFRVYTLRFSIRLASVAHTQPLGDFSALRAFLAVCLTLREWYWHSGNIPFRAGALVHGQMGKSLILYHKTVWEEHEAQLFLLVRPTPSTLIYPINLAECLLINSISIKGNSIRPLPEMYGRNHFFPPFFFNRTNATFIRKFFKRAPALP